MPLLAKSSKAVKTGGHFGNMISYRSWLSSWIQSWMVSDDWITNESSSLFKTHLTLLCLSYYHDYLEFNLIIIHKYSQYSRQEYFDIKVWPSMMWMNMDVYIGEYLVFLKISTNLASFTRMSTLVNFLVLKISTNLASFTPLATDSIGLDRQTRKNFPEVLEGRQIMRCFGWMIGDFNAQMFQWSSLRPLVQMVRGSSPRSSVHI